VDFDPGHGGIVRRRLQIEQAGREVPMMTSGARSDPRDAAFEQIDGDT
jgi:hypothetical protein